MADLVWLVTGAARGLGLALAREILDRGDHLVAGARDPDRIPRDVADRAMRVRLDVTDRREVSAAVVAAEDSCGRIDVVVNCAGRGVCGAVEETSDSEARAIFDVNVFGVLNVTRAVLPGMRRRRAGTVVNIGSTGGFIGAAGWGLYGATKFAIEGISEAVRAEVDGFGIRVLLAEPAMLATGFRDEESLLRISGPLADYSPLRARLEQGIAAAGPAVVGDSRRAAAAIVAVATAEAPASRTFLATTRPSAIADKCTELLGDLDRWQDISSDRVS